MRPGVIREEEIQLRNYQMADEIEMIIYRERERFGTPWAALVG